MTPKKLKLGTRKSPLAIIQAKQVQALLQKAYPDTQIEVLEIMSQGDIDKVSPLSQIGGKGVFVKALEEALLNEHIDIAIHSLKDITSTAPKDLVLSGFLTPEARTDTVVFHSESPPSLELLPKGAVIGTSSMRRTALLAWRYPQLKTVHIRGNVETRLTKMNQQNLAATLLSTAGLKRLNKWGDLYQELPPTTFIPAPGQGVVTMQTRQKSPTHAMCVAISDTHQTELSQLEMAILTKVGLDCRYPFGLYIVKKEQAFQVRAFVASQDCQKQVLFSYTFKNKDICLQRVSEEVIKALKDLNK